MLMVTNGNSKEEMYIHWREHASSINRDMSEQHVDK